MRTIHLLPVLALSLVSCASTGAGQTPPELAELLALVRPHGAVELEIRADGSYGDLEAEVPVESVPDSILEALAKEFPGATLEAVEREYQGGAWTWELGFKLPPMRPSFDQRSRERQAVFSEEGAVLEVEQPVTPFHTPHVVLTASEELLEGSTLVGIDQVDAGERVTYHVKRELEGRHFKAVYGPEGELLHLLQEIPAEIEVHVDL